MKKYDYIFIGGGCAALSLLTRMIAAGLTQNKKVLVIDRAPKQVNDRTWCFWEMGVGFFEPVICKSWNHAWFYSTTLSKLLNFDPYQYKMIRAIDFYSHCNKIIQEQTGIDIIYGEIGNFSVTGKILELNLDDNILKIEAAVTFNSIYREEQVLLQKPVYLVQHFKGWMVEAALPVFNPAEATLMDFRVSQSNGTSFVYVLPLTATKALVEYTLFSEKLLADHLYNEALSQYLQDYLHLENYSVAEQEFGVIPMTNASFPWFANGMYHIGTAGGQTKASSGYTFQFIQKQSAAIVRDIAGNNFVPALRSGASPKRFQWYDSILLSVLKNNYTSGRRIFSDLFAKNDPHTIFAFLDNESSLKMDAGIISSLPTWPFLKAAFRQVSAGL